MILDKHQRELLTDLLKDLNHRCTKGEVVKPFLSRFTCGFAEIHFDLDFEGKPIARGSYEEIKDYLQGE